MGLCIIGQEKSESNIRLLEEAKKKFDSVFFVPIDSIGIGLNTDFSISYRTSDILKFDAVLPRIPKQYHSYAYQLLSLFPSDTFMPIKPISFLLADERFFLLTVLRKRGIPTINLHLTRSGRAASRIIEQVDFPLILRTPNKKIGVVVKNKLETKSIIDALTHLQQPILIENMIKDMVSVYVAEPEVIASVKKKTKEPDIIFSSGEYKSNKIDLEVEQLALEAARAVDAQVARIDISLNSEPKIVNINLNPDLMTPSKITKTDIPKSIIDAVHKNYSEHKERPLLMKFFDDAKSVVKDVLKTKQLL
jgi:glutathione synthase/RimK-type ligase-like ATP-grasp enzyme